MAKKKMDEPKTWGQAAARTSKNSGRSSAQDSNRKTKKRKKK